jgi:hypothetical protein
MECPKCKKKMVNKGNVSGIIYTSNPVQWDDVYVCEECQVKKTMRVWGKNLEQKTYSTFTEI